MNQYLIVMFCSFLTVWFLKQLRIRLELKASLSVPESNRQDLALEECPICNEENIPRNMLILPCHKDHRVCARCLLNIGKFSNTGKVFDIKCPYDREEHVLLVKRIE